VKIDRSFVDSLDTNPGDTAIVAAIIEMSTRLGLDIIAEGVETTTQLRLLHSLGINLAQGYLFAPPGPAQMVDALVFAGSDLLRRPARMGS
jgi:EAL domain-containing protein (putative c-di-GMP-specific phosphodiesterase class I)